MSLTVSLLTNTVAVIVVAVVAIAAAVAVVAVMVDLVVGVTTFSNDSTTSLE